MLTLRAGWAILVSGAVLSTGCTSDNGAQTEVAVDGGGGVKAGSGGAPLGSGGVHAGSGGASAGSGGAQAGSGGVQAGAGGAHVASGGSYGGSAGAHTGGTAGLHSGGTDGGVFDSGLDGSACGSNDGMCCCAGDEETEPVCTDGGWICQGDGYFAFYGDDCTRVGGPCWLPGPPNHGQAGSPDSGGT